VLTPEQISVLVIDDDEIAREYLCDVLRRAGFVVEDTSSTIGVTNKLVRDRFQVVVLDVMMPAIRGDKLAGLLRKNPHLRELGVVMVSGAPKAEIELLVQELDPGDVINKGEARSKLAEAVLLAARERPVAIHKSKLPPPT
jgi:FixJ family two-component response regulator